ncbi:MAG TPA: alkaline phosphatase family protein [Longimicrobiales bacterium]|nr:alkaline phosphatase family protein [Longimicrobiales bacterium]
MWRWVVAGAVLLLAGIATLLLVNRPAAELLGIVAGGGVEVLRDPMRPAGQGQKVLVIALDGVGDDELLAAIEAGQAPHIAALLGPRSGARIFDRGYAVPDVLSILPSTTMAAWASLFSGTTAAFTGVPGNEWFVREEMRFYAPAPVSVEGTRHALEAYTDDLLGRALRAPTVYERADVRAYVSLSQFHRGADLLVVPSASALADLVTAAFEGLTDDTDSVEQEAYADLDLNALDNLIEAVTEHGVADLQVVYFPGIDLYTHIAEPPLESQRDYITDVIDVGVGRLIDLYRQAGVMDSTWVLFVSDHGHTPVLDDDRHALGADDSSGLVTLLEQAGFRVRPRDLDVDDDEQDFQATFAFQGAFAYVYLADRSSCANGGVCNWALPPRFEEDVIPVLDALHAANSGSTGGSSLQGTLDLIFSRAPRPYREDADPFSVWDGHGLISLDEFLANSPRPDLLDLERRLQGLGAGPFGHRAGDILLLARTGMARPIEDRYYFSSRYRSWHGSPDAQDSRIPLVISHGSLSGPAIRDVVTEAAAGPLHQEDIADLILGLLRR